MNIWNVAKLEATKSNRLASQVTDLLGGGPGSGRKPGGGYLDLAELAHKASRAAGNFTRGLQSIRILRIIGVRQ